MLRLRTQRLKVKHNIDHLFFRSWLDRQCFSTEFSMFLTHLLLPSFVLYLSCWILRRCHLCTVFLLQIWEGYCVSSRRNSQLCMCRRAHAAVYESLGLLSVSFHDRYTHKWMWGWWRCLYVPWTAWQQASLAEVTHGWLWISLFYTFICIAVGEVCVGLM